MVKNNKKANYFGDLTFLAKYFYDILFLIFFARGQNALLCLPLSAPSSGPEGADAVGLGEARGGLGWTIQAMSERPVLRSDY